MYLMKYVFSMMYIQKINIIIANKNRVLSSDVPATELCAPIFVPVFWVPQQGDWIHKFTTPVPASMLRGMTMNSLNVNFPGLRGI